MDEKARLALEENAGLKSYIESMNNECLELNAALFEEANKMVRLARNKQSNAERLANDRAAENEALQAQVEELRAVITSLPSPLFPGKAATIPPLHRAPFKSHRRRMRPATEIREAPVYRMSVEDLRLLVPSSSDASTLTAVSRGTLLNALLANEGEAEEMDVDTFKLFIEWTKLGFPLSLPVKLHTQCSKRHVNLDTDSGCPVVIVHEGQNNCNGDFTEEDEEVEDGSDADEAPLSVLSFSHQPILSQFELNMTDSARCCGFMQRIFVQDIRPCLHFADPSITMAIYHALPTMSLEIVPLEHRCFLHTTAALNDSTKTSAKTCPLLPPLDVNYRLTVKSCTTLPGGVLLESQVKEKAITVDICASARDRIAAVVSLFQYLSLVGRGLANSTPSSSRSVSLINLSSPHAQQRSRTLPGTVSSVDLGKQFSRIQRLRLVVAMARLGFGLPE